MRVKMDFIKSILKGEMKAKDSMDGVIILYHYTSRSAAESISLRGKILNGRSGILLNAMEPDRYYRSEILYNNYGDKLPPSFQNRADYCVKVRSSRLIKDRLKRIHLSSDRLIYLYDGDIQVKEVDVYDKPTCNRNPHPHATQSDVQQSSSSSMLRSGQEPVHSRCDNIVEISDDESVKSEKDGNAIEIKINLRSGIKLSGDAQMYQDENVTIFANEWMKDGLKILRKSIGEDIMVNVDGYEKHRIHSGDFTLKDLQIVSRNESSNINGVINFRNYSGLSNEVIYSLKDLTRQTVIIGKDRTTHYGGYPHANRRVLQWDLVYVCDLIGLQFQQPYNSGRLVLVGENLPKGLLDEFIYEQVVKEQKPTIEQVRRDHSDRFIECCGVFFDSKAYVKFVSNDVVLTGIALHQSATEPLNFKFLKYGTGFFAGPFRLLLERFIGRGVADGLENLLKLLPKNHRIKRIELPFFDENPHINCVCSKYDVELKYGTDDALKKTQREYTTATTNSADPHTTTGNKMGFGSVDGAIAENLGGKAIKFSPIINQLMKECFVKID